MRPTTLELIRAVVRDHSGIVIEEGKESLVQTRLLPLARSRGVRTVDELCSRLPHDRTLREQVIEAMTTNETRFFRDEVPFTLLADKVIPAVMRQNEAARTLRIWSAACATGQEPYSIAIMLFECFPELGGWDVQILATDLSRDVLERAKLGRYRRVEVGRGLSPEQLYRYFDQQGDLWTIKNHLRHRVDFRYHNLTAPWPRLPTFDVVFLRNVLIYFDADTKRKVLERTWRQTAENGFLFLGASERPPHDVHGWERLDAPRSGCYRRLPTSLLTR